ncbi:MAG: Na+/H+ antiporter [Acidimicrobiaceae bacterium]|nr:Na+/H+ antiporter [Acidimicrobiaceae bacterium]
MHSVEAVLALVVVATVVATFARHLRVPAPSLLVVVGVGVGLIPGVPAIRVTPNVVSLVVLPPLVYAAGVELAWRDLKQVWRPVAVLAVGLVVASAAGVAVLEAVVSHLSGETAFVLGAILASTDPVAVTALARRLSLPAGVQALIQAESLFNDATSLILFRVAVSIAVVGGGVAWGHTILEFLRLAGGGAAVGAVVALAVGLLRRRTQDPVLETVIVLITPYLAYVAGEALGTSGVTAVVVASVALGNRTASQATGDIRLQLEAVYGTVVFLLESVVFALIGLELPVQIRDLSGVERLWPLAALAVVGVLLVMRVLWVFPLSAVDHVLRRRPGRPSWQVPAVVTWAGARGVIPLAAALSIPLTTENGAPFPDRGLIQVLATMVIVITLAVQGFTLGPLVRRARVSVDPSVTGRDEAYARRRMASSALEHLEQLAELEAAPGLVIEQLRRSLLARLDHLDGDVDPARPETSLEATYRRLRHDLIGVERAELALLYDQGRINGATRRRLARMLDLEQAGLSG